MFLIEEIIEDWGEEVPKLILKSTEREVRFSHSECYSFESGCQYEGTHCQWEITKIIIDTDITFTTN